MKNIRFLITATVLLLVATVAWSSGPGETPGKTTAIAEKSWETDTSPVTLKFYLDKVENYDATWGKNTNTRRFIEATGVDLEWIYAPDGNQTMLNMMIAGGDLPDIMWVDSNLTQMVDLARNDQIWALNKLSELYAPQFMDRVMKTYPHVLRAVRMEFETMDMFKANCYAVPKNRFNDPMYVKNFQGVVLIKEIYEELGKPALKSGDDLIKLLRAVKAKNPKMIPAHPFRYNEVDGFGSPTIIFANLPNAGLGSAVRQMGSKYVLFYEHPNFVKLLKLVNQMYNEGLTNKDVLTETKDELRQKLYTGQVFMQMNQDADNIGSYQSPMDQIDPNFPHPKYTWTMVEPWVIDPATMKYEGDSIGGGVGNQGFTVPKNTKYPDRAIRWIDYILSDEYQRLLWYGKEGVEHTLDARGNPVLKPEILEARKKPDFGTTIGLNQPSVFRMDWYKRLYDFQDAEQLYPEMAKAFTVSAKYYEDSSFLDGATTWPPNSDEQKIYALVKEEYTKRVVALIIGSPGNVESSYSEMMAQLKKLGLDKLNDYMTSYLGGKKGKLDKFGSGLSLPY